MMNNTSWRITHLILLLVILCITAKTVLSESRYLTRTIVLSPNSYFSYPFSIDGTNVNFRLSMRYSKDSINAETRVFLLEEMEYDELLSDVNYQPYNTYLFTSIKQSTPILNVQSNIQKFNSSDVLYYLMLDHRRTDTPVSYVLSFTVTDEVSSDKWELTRKIIYIIAGGILMSILVVTSSVITIVVCCQRYGYLKKKKQYEDEEGGSPPNYDEMSEESYNPEYYTNNDEQQHEN
jgi:hypothetical protein